MYIKYNEFELLELFGNELVSIGDLEAGELIYSLSDDKGFKIVMFISVYQNVCEVSMDYQELNVFTCRIEKVVSINKVNDEMIIYNEEKSVLKVKFKEQIGVELL